MTHTTSITVPIRLGFGPTETIVGTLTLTVGEDGPRGSLGKAVATAFPSTLKQADADVALKVAILDGRIRVPDDVARELDLDGSAPRVS